MAESMNVQPEPGALLHTRIGAPDRSKEMLYSLLASVALHALVVLAWPALEARTERRGEAEQRQLFLLEVVDLVQPALIPDPAAERPAGPARSAKPSAPLGQPVLAPLPALPDLAGIEEDFVPLPAQDLSTFNQPIAVDLSSLRKPGEGEGVGAGVGSGGGEGDEWSEYVAFSPMMVKPEIRNREEVRRFLEKRYQPILRKTGANGVVMLAFWIDEKGKAQRAEIVSSSGNAQLDDTAMLLSDVIRFSPAVHMGKPIRVRVEVPIRFQERS